MKRKNGYMMDVAFLGVFMLVFIIVIMVGGRIFGDYNTKYQGLNTSSTGIGQDIMNDYTNRYSTIYDWIFTSVLVFFAIGLLISFSMIDTHPAFFFIVLIVFVVIIVVNGIFQNVFERFTEGSFGIDAANYSMTNYIMNHWVLFIVVIGFVSMGVLFAKLRTGIFR